MLWNKNIVFEGQNYNDYSLLIKIIEYSRSKYKYLKYDNYYSFYGKIVLIYYIKVKYFYSIFWVL